MTSNSYSYNCATGTDELPENDGITGDIRWINLFGDALSWNGNGTALLANRVTQTGNDDMVQGSGLTKGVNAAFYGAFIMNKRTPYGYRVSMRSAVYGTGEEPYKEKTYDVIAVVELLDTVKIVERI